MESFNKQNCVDGIIEDMADQAESAFKALLKGYIKEVMQAQEGVNKAIALLMEKRKALKELQYVEPDFSGISTEDLL